MFLDSMNTNGSKKINVKQEGQKWGTGHDFLHICEHVKKLRMTTPIKKEEKNHESSCCHLLLFGLE